MTRLASLLLLVAACSSGGGADLATLPANLEVAPHVRRLASDSVVIGWISGEAELGEVECLGHEGLFAVLAGVEPTREHEFRIDGLQPDSVYRYRIAGQTEEYEFRTPPADGGPFTFAVFGDMGNGGAPQLDARAVLERSAPAFVLTTGDNAYDAGRWDEVLKFYFAPYAELMARIPFYPALGNHDVVTADGAPLLTLAGIDRYYAVRHGNGLFLCLDSTSDLGPGSPQHDWLVAELATSVVDWTILYFHHPPYSSGGHGSDLDVRAALAPVLEQFHVDLVFNGHDHAYERTVPIRNGAATAGAAGAYTDPDGTIFVVTGGGGKRLYEVGHEWFTAHARSVHHVVRVTIDGLTLSLEAVDTADRVFDRVTVTKTD